MYKFEEGRSGRQTGVQCMKTISNACGQTATQQQCWSVSNDQDRFATPIHSLTSAYILHFPAHLCPPFFLSLLRLQNLFIQQEETLKANAKVEDASCSSSSSSDGIASDDELELATEECIQSLRDALHVPKPLSADEMLRFCYPKP